MNTIIEKEIHEMLASIETSFLHNKSILVTGASGLVGSYFSVLFQEIRKSRGIDFELYLTSKSGEFEFNIENATIIIAKDLSRSETITKMPSFDIIIHAAGYAQPSKFLADTRTTIRLATETTYELIGKLKTGGRFLFFSTSEVYSDLPKPPFREDQIGLTNTNHPRAAYIEAKRLGETIVHLANREKNIVANSIRLASAFGPGVKQNDSRVMSNIIHQALSDKHIKLKDNGDAWRTFCYITDVIEMSYAVLQKGCGEVYNVGGVSRVQIKDLAKIVSEETGAKLTYPTNDENYLKGAPTDVSLDLTKILNLCGQRDFVDFHTGIRKTILWQKNHVL